MRARALYVLGQLHPTTYFHDELGRLMAQAVPELATLILLLQELLIMGWLVHTPKPSSDSLFL